MTLSVAYQGVPGSFSYLAAEAYFPSGSEFLGTQRFRDIFEMVLDRRVDFGFVPIENSLAGSVHENYDLLTRNQVYITGEAYLQVEHQLLGIAIPGLKGSERLKKIQKVYSHPKALEQCVSFFERNPSIEQYVFSDTAGAAKDVSDRKDETLGAIASKKAGELYGLEVIESNIEDDPNNYTRFVVIAREMKIAENANKCSLQFKLPHVPRSLLGALEVFEACDLTKIESRPIHGQPFNYLFHLDFEYKNLGETEVKNVLDRVKEKTVDLRILGKYRSAR